MLRAERYVFKFLLRGVVSDIIQLSMKDKFSLLVKKIDGIALYSMFTNFQEK